MFKHPATIIVSGPTGSGKSHLTKKIVANASELIYPPPDVIFWHYAEDQGPVPGCEMIEGPPNLAELKADKRKKLVIIDDLADEIPEKDLSIMYTRGSHHWSMTIIFISQNCFHKSMRTARINSHYLILLKNPSDKLQVMNLAKQLYPGQHQYFLESYNDACSPSHGYLMIDLNPTSDDSMRLMTHIFPDEYTTVYQPCLRASKRV